MKVIKRNGSEVEFDIDKIRNAIAKANKAAIREELSQAQIDEIADYINFKCSKMNRAISVEEMQDMVPEPWLERATLPMTVFCL